MCDHRLRYVGDSEHVALDQQLIDEPIEERHDSRYDCDVDGVPPAARSRRAP